MYALLTLLLPLLLLFAAIPAHGQPNATSFLQALLNPTQPSQTVIIPPGVWMYDNTLRLTTPGTIIQGQNAVLMATNPSRSALVVQGNGITLQNLTLATIKPTSRNTMPAGVRILVRGNGAKILSNTILGGAGGGIMLLSAHNTQVIGNRVLNTLADAIHTTGTSVSATITHNLVSNSGDDGIAVVAYASQPTPSHHITIAENMVSNLQWGRGVTVIGGHHVSITANTITNIACCAGIKIAQDTHYNSHSPHTITITSNTISHIQMGPPPSKTGRYTHQAAIDLNASTRPNTPSSTVHGVTIANNTIHHTRFAGIRLMGHVCQTRITGNQFNTIGYTPILLTQPQCPQNPITQLQANTLGSTPITTPTLQPPPKKP